MQTVMDVMQILVKLVAEKKKQRFFYECRLLIRSITHII